MFSSGPKRRPQQPPGTITSQYHKDKITARGRDTGSNIENFTVEKSSQFLSE